MQIPLSDKTAIIAYGLRLTLLLAALYIAVITAWVSDDAQISFRQVWNFIHGDGMTFNVGERVQAFTHPSWFLLLSGIVAVTQELFLTTLVVSIVLSVAAIALLLAAEWRASRGRIPLLTPALLLFFSVAFCDYMTSGLENPLSYFLIGLLLWVLASPQPTARWGQGVFLLLALLALNRLDYAALFLPLALLLAAQGLAAAGLHGLWREIWPGAALLLLWFGFALFYFGFPLPNTFYAKLSAGFPLMEMLERGVNYYVVTVQRDPISLIIIFAGLVASVASRNRLLLALAAGQLLYLGYILLAGGDFMQGRFFAVPVFLAAGQLVLAFAERHQGQPDEVKLGPQGFITVVLLLLALGIGLGNLRGNQGQFPFLSTSNYTNRYFTLDIADERGYYYREFGLLSPQRKAWPQMKRQPDHPHNRYRIRRYSMGREGALGPEVYMIERMALANPFLAHLPALRTPDWRIGHARRKLPTDFGEFMVGNIQSMPDAATDSLFQDIKLAARGQLFSSERLVALWRLNTGQHADLDLSKYADSAVWVPLTSDEAEYRRVSLEELDTAPKPDGYPYWQEKEKEHVWIFYPSLFVALDTPQRAAGLSLGLGKRDAYDIYVNGQRVAQIGKVPQQHYGLRTLTVPLPAPQLIESVEVRGIDGADYIFVVGHLQLLPHHKR